MIARVSQPREAILRKRGRSPKLIGVQVGHTNRVRHMLAQLLDVATHTLRDLAKEAGISYFAIRSYRRAERMPSPPVLRRLAAAMRKRGGQLAKAATRFEQLAREQGRTSRTGRTP